MIDKKQIILAILLLYAIGILSAWQGQSFGKYFVSYSPSQLGVNALAYGSNGQSAASAIVDMRSVKGWTLLFNCTSSVTVQLNNMIEDGVTGWNNSSALTGVNAGQTTWSMNAGSTGFSTQGAVSTSAQNFPMRAMSFQFMNTNATAGTCTARLFLSY